MELFGTTRSRVMRNYALITPDTHVESPLVGWEGASAVVHISPEMSARFTQYTARLEAGGASGSPGAGVERFVYVLDGEIDVEAAGETKQGLAGGGFAYLPADTKHAIRSARGARLTVFEKVYRPLDGAGAPRVVIGDEGDVAAEPFQGNENARLKTLLPIEAAFDMAVNIFTYQPGATLPQVEIHVMEHGLLMLTGQGVYRLGEEHYPVREGDVIWMASYCPQWFVAMGNEPARYIYYKDIHRDALTMKA